MRKILSMMMALVLSVTMANAEATRLYCKVTQSWWKADGAAVAIFAWTDGGTNNGAWPGVRMTAVEGETDMWYGDVDPAVHNKLIFVRVNGSGDIADWGAKTADLTFPTDGKNLYTITSETAVWGDPGVTGEWSVKGEQQGGDEPEPQGCNWNSLEWLGNGSGVAAYTNAFKVCVPEGVGVVNVQTPGFATAPGIYITLPSVPSACSLAENQYDVQGAGVILHCDAFVQEETEVSFVYNGGECTVTVYRKPSYYVVGDAATLGAWTPANGVKIFGDSVSIHLVAGTYKFKVVNGPSWEGTTSLGYADLKEGQTSLSSDNDGNICFTLAADADVAIKIENSKVIVTLPAAQGGDEPEPQPQPTINYYLVGSMQSWSLENAIPLPGDSLVIEDAAAGNYAFKLLPQKTGWDNALTYSNINAECSSAGITEGENGNIVVTLAQAGSVKIKVVNGQLCITGNFEVPVTYNYYLVGSMQSWSLENAIPMPGDSVVVTWAANVYQFKVLPQNTGWANEMGYSAVNAECSSDGIQDGGGGNIKITLAAETEVKIKVVNGQLCITGNFGGQVQISSYTVVGDPLLIAAGWETTSTATDMTAQQDGSWTYTLSSVELETGHNYQYKMVANHSWDVAQYPQSGDYILTVDVNGLYSVLFTLVPGEVGGSAVATLLHATDLQNSTSSPEVVKFVKDGQLYIRANGQEYNVMGQIVK